MKSGTKSGVSALLVLLLILSPLLALPVAAVGEAIAIAVELESFRDEGDPGSTQNVGGDSASTLLWKKGDADATGGVLRVVPDRYNKKGTVVRRNQIQLTDGFSTYFSFKITGADDIADGLAFLVYESDTVQIGTYGGGLGYKGIDHSIAVEFDDFYNTNDPDGYHVGIMLNGDEVHGSANPGASFPSLENNTIHAWVDYKAGRVTATYGLSPTRSDNSTITRDVGTFLEGKNVFVGFSASTGGSKGNHDILKWYFKDSYVSGGLSAAANAYTQAASSVGITFDSDTHASTATITTYSAAGSALANQSVSIYIDGVKQTGTYATGSDGTLSFPLVNIYGGQHEIRVVAEGGATKAAVFNRDSSIVTSGTSVTASGISASPVVVDNGLLIQGFDDSFEIPGARVTIDSIKSGDELIAPETLPDGVSSSWSSATGSLIFSGNMTASELQALLRAVEFKTTSTDTASRTISFSIGSFLPGPDNRFYEYVTENVNWTDAKDAASKKSYLGMLGYLATITSADENTLINKKLGADAWIGATDAASEGTWKWVTGPESGQTFIYTNWNSAQPDNWSGSSSGNENYAEMYKDGTWNDLDDVVHSFVKGYVVEYGGMNDYPVLNISDSQSIAIDNTQPTVTINQAAGQSDPSNNSTLSFTAIFSKTVTGFTAEDVILSGTAGGTKTVGISGSGTDYTISVSGMTSDGTVIAQIAAGAAQDATGNSSKESTSTDNSITYDQTSPTVTINQAEGQIDPSNSSSLQFTVVFSEAVSGFTATDITLGGTAGGTKSIQVTDSGDHKTYTVSVSGMTDGTVIASLAAGVASDAAGNGSAASTSTDRTILYDGSRPTVTINQAESQDDPSNNDTFYFTVVFNEPVTGFSADDVTLSGTAGGTKVVEVSGSGKTYTVTVSGMTSDGTVIASLPADVASDSAGNTCTASTSTDNSILYDITRPTVTIDQADSQDDPSNNDSLHFTVVFSEEVTGFTNSDVTLTGTAGGTKVVAVSGSGTTYTVSISGMTEGTVIASLAAGVALDAAGNPSTASASTDNSILYDITRPTVTINQTESQDDPSNNDTLYFKVVFSKPVTGFTNSDVTLAGTAGGRKTIFVNGSGTTYTVSVAGMTDGTVIASLAEGVAADAAGNTNVASTSTDNSIVYDNTRPSVTINQAESQDDPTNNDTLYFTVVFSEEVTGLTSDDITLSGTAGGTKTIDVTGSGTTYTVTVTGMTEGTVIASLAADIAVDAAGNTSTASTSTDHSILYDITRPTVTINQSGSQDDPSNNDTLFFTVAFSEEVAGLTTDDITLSGTADGTKSIIVTDSGDHKLYTVSVTGMTDGTIIASLTEGVATDAAGNTSTASTSTDNSILYDITRPTVTINQARGQADPSLTKPVYFTVVFSEPFSGFSSEDIYISGSANPRSVSISGSGLIYTVAVSGMTQTGSVKATVRAGAVYDASGNANLASTSIDNTVTYDTRVHAVTLATTESDGVKTTDLGLLVAIPEMWMTDTEMVEFWLESLEISSITPESEYNYISLARSRLYAAGYQLLAPYDIELKQRVHKASGEVLVSAVDNAHIRGNVTVLLPIPTELLSLSNLKIAFIDDSGAVAFLDSERVTIDGVEYLEFANNHFSVYAIVSAADANSLPPIPTTGDDRTPKISPFLATVYGIALLLLGLLLVWYRRMTRRRKDKKSFPG